MKNRILSFALLSLGLTGFAQTRYVDDVFTRSSVVKTSNVPYGQNFYFLSFPPAPQGSSSTNPLLGDLLMDMYTPPVNDVETNRPLLLS